MKIFSEFAQIFDVFSEGILIIDESANIIYANKAYCSFINVDISEILEKKLKDIRPRAMLPNVLKTGRPILNAPRYERDEPYFVNLYPIISDNEVIGGITVVTFIQQAHDYRHLLQEIERSKQVIKQISKIGNAGYTFDDIVAVDSSSVKVKTLAKKAANSDATVLLQSESGTGKELYAQAIHNASKRSGNVFLAINCANFNSNILEAELFGYLEGSFTGAKKGGKIGLFEAATKGTIFLDEISEMNISLQANLLRVLQEHKIRPVGGVTERDVDVRVIAACNAPLLKYIEEGRFRRDLYYRLNIFPLAIAPLRDRKDDIEPLVKIILGELSKKQYRSLLIEEDALKKLRAYDWPGNVRELRNVLEFVSYLSDDGIITENALPEAIASKYADENETLSQRVKRFEKSEIERLLRKNGNCLAGKRKTAADLGISLASLYNKIGSQI